MGTRYAAVFFAPEQLDLADLHQNATDGVHVRVVVQHAETGQR